MITDIGNSHWPGYFLYSPSRSYPKPHAALMDAKGKIVHTWSNDEDQPASEHDPPSFLRGWNHVELDREGNFYAIVPLQSVLKLDRRSNLIWKAEVGAHHDLEITETGQVIVLTETPRVLRSNTQDRIILDNEITFLDVSGKLISSYSLYDILTTDQTLRDILNIQIEERFSNFEKLTNDTGGNELKELLQTGLSSAPRRQTLQLLRQLPGSPCDIIHANALESLSHDIQHMWQPGQILISLRNLDLIAVINLTPPRVCWTWGRGALSGQHQPSLLPDGRLLIFDNGVTVGRSRILEIDPLRKQITWEYASHPPHDFFSQVAGGCELLPNGNILATHAQAGRAIEVTRDRRVVWRWELSVQPTDGNASRADIYRLAAVLPETAQAVLQG